MYEHVELCVTSQRLSRTLKTGVSFSKVLYPTWLLFCHVCASGPDLSSGNCFPSHASDVTLIVGSALRVMSKQLSCDTLAESLDACACVHAPPLLNCVHITL